jgi:hypothetical protein
VQKFWRAFYRLKTVGESNKIDLWEIIFRNRIPLAEDGVY